MSELLNFLLKIKKSDNRGVLATLRCALVENKEIRAWSLLASFGGIGKNQEARTVCTTAGLFASHPENCTSGNMGNVCRSLCRKDEIPEKNIDEKGDAVPPGPMGKRFMHLLNSDREQIFERVTRIVLYAKKEDIPINYAQLEKDLRYWPKAREDWANSFWNPVKSEDMQKGADS